MTPYGSCRFFSCQFLGLDEIKYTPNEIKDDHLDEEWLRRVQQFRNNARFRPCYYEEHPLVLHPTAYGVDGEDPPRAPPKASSSSKALQYPKERVLRDRLTGRLYWPKKMALPRDRGATQFL